MKRRVREDIRQFPLPDASNRVGLTTRRSRRTRRLIHLKTHEAVFAWMLQQLADAGVVEANAALRSIVRRDTGESYREFLTQLAQAACG